MSNEPASLSISEDMPDDFESGIYGKSFLLKRCLEQKYNKLRNLSEKIGNFI